MVTKKSSATKVAYAAILAALAMIFSYIEAIIPFSVGIPGVKLGIANLVILIALYKLDLKYAFLINLIRIFLVGFLFTGAFGILYSLAGGLLSLLVMVIVKNAKIFSVVGVSLAGGVAHNLGQLITAALIVSNIKLFAYFPVLIFSGLISGIIIGIVAGLILMKLEKFKI